MLKKWIIYPKKSDDIIEQLLINRGIKDKESFLNPDFEKDIYDPYLLKGMSKAVKRVLKAKVKNEKIGIFADYDADGIPGAVLLTRVFKKIGIEVEIYIPKRDEGYGLSKSGIDYLFCQGSKLLVTIDLGITGKKEVEYAHKLGMDVIITDHHIIMEDLLPLDTVAIIHPDQSGQKYPNKFLSGGAVAWKFASAIIYEIEGESPKTINYLKWLLDLTAIATICDMVPLIGENRTIAKYGLIVLGKTKNLGLKELYSVARIKEDSIGTYTVGFQIGPRINAPGRMDHATASYHLLVTDDPQRAYDAAQKLNETNINRQAELLRVFEEAKSNVLKNMLHEQKIIIVHGKNWPDGIVGLVAGKLTEMYSRPVIVLNEDKGKYKGSARSISDFHLLEALEQCQKHLSTFGGHARAAGLSLEKKHLKDLYDKLLEIIDSKLDFSDLVPKIKIDAELSAGDITLDTANNIWKFEPFGLGNPEPIFLVKGLIIKSKKLLGAKKNHIKLALEIPGMSSTIDSIGFDMKEVYDKLTIGDQIDIVGFLDINEWNGQKKVQLRIMDVKYE